MNFKSMTKNIDYKKLAACYNTHNAYFEGGNKIHIMNYETGRCLCGYDPGCYQVVDLDCKQAAYVDHSLIKYVSQPDPDNCICERCKNILLKWSEQK